MTGYRSGFVCAPPEIVDGAAERSARRVGTAPQEFVQRASVAAWSDDGARRRRPGDLPAQARDAAAGAARARACGSPGRRRRSTSGSTSAGPSEPFARRLLEHGIVVAPGLVLRPGRRGLRPARARADAGGVRARGRDPRAGAVTTDETIAALDRGEVRVAEPRRRRLARQRGRAGGDPRLLPLAPDGAARGRAVRVPRQDPAQERLRGSSACASCRRRSRATARSSRAASC